MYLRKDLSLKSLNTFGIDAKASYFGEFYSVMELQNFIADPEFHQVEKLILGGGSNLLFTKDFDGIVLHNKIKGKEIIEHNDEYAYVRAGAGEIWHEFVLFCIENGFAGLENLSLIPGTVGAAPMQNIGAYGVEIKDSFAHLEAVNIIDGKIYTFDKESCQFGYRESIFKKELKGQYIITSVVFKLSKKPQFNISYGAIKTTLEEMGIENISIKAISDAVCSIRKSKLPDPAVIGNAGSFFKNPEIPETQYDALKARFPDIPSYKTTPGMVKVPAGWLNEQCGWKGRIVGRTGVHKNQALVLVNYGNATGAEVKKLSEDIKRSVKEKFGIELEIEVNII
ncbi:MAG TPA: UDP-N-acetylmuramate dehydrogenase [Cytophagaceae bacterium]|nr:UDP-N-acetylmuramate dehydrogenase [Cytophagaceae bacterium]